MANLKLFSVIFGLILAVMVLSPASRADVWNQRTELNFSQPVEIPGRVLPAGTYWFVLFNSESDRDIVQVFNADNSQLCATLITAPTVRNSAGDTEVVFAERRHSQPEALWKWYYPGLQTGHEFLYPAHEEKNLRQDPKQVVNGVPPLTVRDTGTAGN